MSVHKLQPDKPEVPPAPPGLEHINRYWDPRAGMVAAKLLPGEFYIAAKEEMLVTVVGSSMAVCARDERNRIGGMVHFMLPPIEEVTDGNEVAREVLSYGSAALGSLLEGLARHGSKREDLVVNLVGGASVWPSHAQTARASVRFTTQFLENEGLQVGEIHLGDTMPRKVYFWPPSGVLFVRNLPVFNGTIKRREDSYIEALQEQWLSDETGTG